MTERESLTEVASEITLWQLTALELSLPEVQAMVTASLRGLAQRLNEFNDTYVAHPEDVTTDALYAIVAKVARQATAVAIFTLGANQRAAQAAARN